MKLNIYIEGTDIIDLTSYNVYKKHIYYFKDKILFLNSLIFKEINKEFLNNGLYLINSKKPLILYNKPYLTNKGYEVFFKREDIETLLNNKGYVKINEKDYLDINKYKKIKDLIVENSDYPVLLDQFVNFSISYYLRNIYTEKFYVDYESILNDMRINIHLWKLDYRYLSLRKYENEYMEAIIDFLNLFIKDVNIINKICLELFDLFSDFIGIFKFYEPFMPNYRITNNMVEFLFRDAASSCRFYHQRYSNEIIEELELKELL